MSKKKIRNEIKKRELSIKKKDEPREVAIIWWEDAILFSGCKMMKADIKKLKPITNLCVGIVVNEDEGFITISQDWIDARAVGAEETSYQRISVLPKTFIKKITKIEINEKVI